MHKRKVTNTFKLAAAAVLAAGVIGGSALAFNVGDSQPVSASQPSTVTDSNPGVDAPNEGGQDALIISAAESYAQQQAYDRDVSAPIVQVSNIINDGLNAKVTIDTYEGNGNGNGSTMILHYTPSQNENVEGKWSVVYAGNGMPSQDTVTKYGLPDDWS